MGRGKLVGWGTLQVQGMPSTVALSSSPAEASIGKDGTSPQLQAATEAVGLLGSTTVKVSGHLLIPSPHGDVIADGPPLGTGSSLRTLSWQR